MSNDIIGRVSAMCDIKIEDDHIADVIQGRATILPQEVREMIFTTVRSYAYGILDKLRELQVDLRANPAIFIGGGSILFHTFIEESPPGGTGGLCAGSQGQRHRVWIAGHRATATDDAAGLRRGAHC